MTSRLPRVTRTVTTLSIGGEDLPVKHMHLSADIDRAVFLLAEFTLGAVTDAQWEQLDPRDSTFRLQFRSRQYDQDGTQIGCLPSEMGATSLGSLVLRRAQRNHITGEVTLTASSAESLLQDKLRIAGTTIDTGATNVHDLVTWSLTDVFGGFYITSDGADASTPIPAGERRLMVQGESHHDLIRPELDAINYRLTDSYGGWCVHNRATTFAVPLKLATYRAGAPGDADPAVEELVEVLDRDGDWADGVLVEYKQPGTPTSVFQASGTGANTKGVRLTRDRTPPAANAANQIVTRSVVRGYDLIVTARARYDGVGLAEYGGSRPQTLTVYTPTRTFTGRIRSIEWDTGTGRMVIRAQTEDPIT